jgi:hypothetical protein
MMCCMIQPKKKSKPKIGRARKVKESKRDIVVNILLSPPELEEIDSFRAKHRFSSRNETLRRLLAYALKESANFPALPL